MDTNAQLLENRLVYANKTTYSLLFAISLGKKVYFNGEWITVDGEIDEKYCFRSKEQAIFEAKKAKLPSFGISKFYLEDK